MRAWSAWPSLNDVAFPFIHGDASPARNGVAFPSLDFADGVGRVLMGEVPLHMAVPKLCCRPVSKW